MPYASNPKMAELSSATSPENLLAVRFSGGMKWVV